ncbi:MAG: energy transducer TonB [Muribaculaceae bacterium]|nr:energy transducer TonB [Muribaculaceae bacterium]
MATKRSEEDVTRLIDPKEEATQILPSELKGSKPQKANRFKWTWILTLSLIGAAILSLFYMLFFRTDETLSSDNYEEGKFSTRPPSQEIRTDNDDIEPLTGEELEEAGTETLEENTDSLNLSLMVLDGGDEAPQTPPATDDNRTYDMTEVSQVPMFNGGDQAMYAWLRSNNQLLDDDSAHGKVVVSFVVEKNGAISDVRIVRGRNAKLDSEAVRLVNAMPSWTPGTNSGTPVRVKYQLPITF